MEEWLQQNVPGWPELNDEEKRALRDFPILWSYFEGWVTYPKTAEPRYIREIIDGAPAENFFRLPHTEQAFEYFRERFFPAGCEAPIFETVQLNRQWKAFVRATLLDPQAEPRQRAKAVLLIVNRLRNNFLHGGKALYNFRGQLENFRHANATLMELLAIWGPRY